MNYYMIFGMVVVALVAIIGFFVSIKKSINDERKPIEDLNVNIVRLNANFEHMIEQDKVRDRRIEKHGAEIDDIDEVIGDHEVRITVLEGKVKEHG